MSAAARATAPQPRLGLSAQIMIGLALGIGVGLFLGDLVGVPQGYFQLYIPTRILTGKFDSMGC